MCNKVLTPERKKVVYKTAYQKFSEVDVNTGIEATGTFKLHDDISADVIHQDKYTIVILEDGTKGISKCMEGDTYSRKVGVTIAFNRAMIKRMKKEINKISNGK